MWSRIRKVLVPPESKSSRVARLIALERGGRPRWTPRDYCGARARRLRPQRHRPRAVRMIAESVGSLCFVLYEGADGARHASAARPARAAQSAPGRRARFSKRVASHLLLAGNAYVEAVTVEGAACASSMRCGPTA